MIQFILIVAVLAVSVGLSFALKKMSRTIMTVGLALVCIVLSWGLYKSIAGEIQQKAAIQKSEAQVIERLKNIRSAQEAYLKQYGIYANNWEELTRFIKEDTIYTVQKNEEQIPREPDDPEFYKGDIIKISYDTIGEKIAQKELFPEEEYPNFEPSKLRYIPGTKPPKEFDMQVSIDSTSNNTGVKINFIEVVDRHPLDKLRKDDNSNPKRRYLRFGSMDNPNTSGNWE